MKKLTILLTLFFVLSGCLLKIWSQSGAELVEKRKQAAEYYYIEFKTYFDQQDYYKALKKIEDAIDAAPLHYDISQFYFDKGEIYRKLYDLNQRDSDIEEAYEAYKESVRLNNRPETTFRMNFSLFELQKNDGVKLNRVDPDQLEKTLVAMWQSILDYEEINAWETTETSSALDEEFELFVEKCIDAALLSQTPNSYLAKIINVCRRGMNQDNPVVNRQWERVEDKLRLDVYNLPCSGNFYLAHQKALEAIREQSERLYDHALNYYRLAADTAQTREARALIYNEMAHFVNSAPFYQLYDAVKYAEMAYQTLPREKKYAEEYGEFLWLIVDHIINVEITGKESFATMREKSKLKKAVKYLDPATRFQWSNQINALVKSSLYHEWLQTPWDSQQTELRQARRLILTAFELSENKNDPKILKQMVRVHQKLGAEGIRQLRELDEKYNMNISGLTWEEEEEPATNRVDILLTQIIDLQAGLFEINLDNYRQFVDIKNRALELSQAEKNNPAYQRLTQEIQQTKSQMDALFSRKVDILYRIGYSEPQETEIQMLSRQVLTDNLLAVSRDTREKVNRISIADRMLRQ